MAKQDVNIISADGKVNLAGAKEVLLTCAGAYISIKDDNIELGCPGNILNKSKVWQKMGPKNHETWLPLLPVYEGELGERSFRLVDINDQPIPNQKYRLYTASNSIEGITDESGHTELINGFVGEAIRIEILEEHIVMGIITTTQTTAVKKQSESVKLEILPFSYAIFIGGAADAKIYPGFGREIGLGPTKIVKFEAFDVYRKSIGKAEGGYILSDYIDYSDILAKSRPNIVKYFNKNPQVNINIVGHSLGGKRAAELSSFLYRKYRIKTNILITIDPVVGIAEVKDEKPGDDFEQDMENPKPYAKMWINILADPNGVFYVDDLIALLGRKWKPKGRKIEQEAKL